MTFKTKMKKDIKFKSEKVWLEGQAITATTLIGKDGQRRPMYASVTNTDLKETITFKTSHLFVLSDEFTKPTEDIINDAITDSTCESITGQTIEPDGYDEYGLPSVLMACGLV